MDEAMFMIQVTPPTISINATQPVQFQEMKRKNGVLTLKGVGVFQGSMGSLNIDDVKCIRDALVKVYLPIIEADPELKAQYEAAVASVRSHRRVNARMQGDSENPQQPAAAVVGNNPFGLALGNLPAGILNAAAALLLPQHQPPQ